MTERDLAEELDHLRVRVDVLAQMVRSLEDRIQALRVESKTISEIVG